MPPAFHTLATAGAAAAPAVTTGLAASSVVAPIVGVLAVALAVSGGLAATSSAQAPSAPSSAIVASSTTADNAGSFNPWVLVPSPSPSSVLGALVPGTAPIIGGIGQTVNGAVSALGSGVDTVVNGVTTPINDATGLALGPGPVPTETAPPGVVGASVALDLNGKGMPGATVAVQAGGVVYATTKVTPQGTWAVHISALPDGVGQLQLKQTLVSLLGIDLVTVPLQVLSNSLGITLDILGH